MRVGVRHDHLGERVVLELGEEVEPRGAIQVVEPVAVLQILELGLEHEVEGRAEHAAERHLLLGQAADPQVDIVEAGVVTPFAPLGPGAGAVEEVEPVGRRAGAAEHEVHGGRALVLQRRSRARIVACVP